MSAAHKGRIAVVGMFDGVHSGHRALLSDLKARASERSLEPMVFTFSNHPLELIRPCAAPCLLSTAAEKVELLAREGIGVVECVPFDEAMRLTSAEGFMHMLRDRHDVRAVLLGFNNRFGHDAPASFEEYLRLGEAAGVEVLRGREFVMESDGHGHPVSSSEIRRMLALGDVAAAATMLGRPYSLPGTVIHGREVGRTIGFPTANLEIPRCKAVPAPGVYAVMACVGSGNVAGFPAMVNIGRRPTVDVCGAPISIEVHIIGLPGNTDLYGRTVTLGFSARIRSEQRFSSLEELSCQLAADREAALEILSD